MKSAHQKYYETMAEKQIYIEKLENYRKTKYRGYKEYKQMINSDQIQQMQPDHFLNMSHFEENKEGFSTQREQRVVKDVKFYSSKGEFQKSIESQQQKSQKCQNSKKQEMSHSKTSLAIQNEINSQKYDRPEVHEIIKFEMQFDSSKCDNNLSQNKDCLQKQQQDKIVTNKPVFIQIPIKDEKIKETSQNVSLAEAFKKRIGKLSSEKVKNTSVTPCKNIKNIYPIKNQNKNKENNRLRVKKQNFKSRTTSLTIDSNSKQPYNQLINRLIYGEKVKINKHQMYALTRRNYNKLPQVQAKLKQEAKKIQEHERMMKTKNYQKQIRSPKCSIRDELPK